VNDLLVGALSALLATNQPTALSNLVKSVAGVSVRVPDKNDPVEAEFQKLMEADDLAQAEVDDWIKENNAFAAKGGGVDRATLNARIEKRFAPIHKGYQDFIEKHPKHAGALLAYGSFLNDIAEEEKAHDYWERARQVDPSNPATWNNLANWYGHNSPVSKSFAYYEKAIELDPAESVYWHNLAITTYMFRHDATNYYKIDVQKVFEKAMGFYRKALELDPKNFLLATDYAQSYYGFKPTKTGEEEADRKAELRHWDEAIKAWKAALEIADDDVERQGVYIHFARIQINAGRLEEARRHLNNVTNETFAATKSTLLKKLSGREASK
jgi:tetratricopeptide (TPR) repeat protein